MTTKLIAAILLFGVAACDSHEAVSEPGSSSPKTVLSITTPTGVYSSPFAATLKATPNSLELGLSGTNGSEQWGAIAGLSPENVQSGAGTLSVLANSGPGPGVATGIANVAKSGEAGTTYATAGTFTFKLRKGGVSGQVADAQP